MRPVRLLALVPAPGRAFRASPDRSAQHVDDTKQRPGLERDDVVELDGCWRGAGAEVVERVGVPERESDAELEHDEEPARFARSCLVAGEAVAVARFGDFWDSTGTARGEQIRHSRHD